MAGGGAGIFSMEVFPGNSGCVELTSELASTVLSELDVQRPVTKAMPQPLQCLQMAPSGALSTLLTLLCTSFFFSIHEGRKRQGWVGTRWLSRAPCTLTSLLGCSGNTVANWGKWKAVFSKQWVPLRNVQFTFLPSRL